MEEMNEEILSILESDSISEEVKSELLESYLFKLGTSSPIKPQEKVQDMGDKIKKDDDDKLNVEGKSEKDKANAKAKEEKEELHDPLTNGEISLILYSEFTLDDQLSILKSNLSEDQMRSNSVIVQPKEKVECVETKPKELDKGDLPSDGISKGTIKSLSQEVKTKVDPDMKLMMLDEKPSSAECNKNEEDITSSKVKTSTTSSPCNNKKEDITSPKVKTSVSPSPCSNNGDDITSSKVKPSTNSLGVELEGRKQHRGPEANGEQDPTPGPENGSFNWIDKTSLRAQIAPADDLRLVLELKGDGVIAKEIGVPENNSEGEVVDRIHKHEAVCKKCSADMLEERINVFKAKCKCKLALIHEQCAEEWEQEKGSTCPSCGEQIRNIRVELKIDTSTSSMDTSTSSPPKTDDKPPSIPKRSNWWCFRN